jgi:membrane-bound serine protease (ClpP class)
VGQSAIRPPADRVYATSEPHVVDMPTSRRWARGTAALVFAALSWMLWGGVASAQAGCEEAGCIDVVAVDGLIDEIEASNIIDTVRAAEDSGVVEAVVLQLDSEGSAVSDRRLGEVADSIVQSSVPITVWIGPSGATARGGAAELAAVAGFSSIAAGASIGDVGSQRLPEDRFGDLFAGDASAALDEVLDDSAAVDAGVVDRLSPIVREHIVNIDGVESEVAGSEGEEGRAPVALVRFSKLPLGTQLMHTVASPSVAYLLIAAAVGLLLFEFYTAGVGVAGVVGAGCLVLGGYGVAALPHNGWALALIAFSAIAFAIDIQSGVPRVWTGIAMVAFTAGSLFLFTEFRPTWIALLVGIVGIATTMFSGMPAMVRTRFGTPTIGRESMVGLEGTAVSAVDPDGTVLIRGALWRARTNRATPILEGDVVRVVEIDGLLLEVEPEEGGAKDYREMRDRRKQG